MSRGWRFEQQHDPGIVDALETRETPEKHHIEIRTSSLKRVAGLTVWLKHFYTNAHSMGNKQWELEATM